MASTDHDHDHHQVDESVHGHHDADVHSESSRHHDSEIAVNGHFKEEKGDNSHENSISERHAISVAKHETHEDDEENRSHDHGQDEEERESGYAANMDINDHSVRRTPTPSHSDKESEHSETGSQPGHENEHEPHEEVEHSQHENQHQTDEESQAHVNSHSTEPPEQEHHSHAISDQLGEESQANADHDTQKDTESKDKIEENDRSDKEGEEETESKVVGHGMQHAQVENEKESSHVDEDHHNADHGDDGYEHQAHVHETNREEQSENSQKEEHHSIDHGHHDDAKPEDVEPTSEQREKSEISEQGNQEIESPPQRRLHDEEELIAQHAEPEKEAEVESEHEEKETFQHRSPAESPNNAEECNESEGKIDGHHEEERESPIAQEEQPEPEIIAATVPQTETGSASPKSARSRGSSNASPVLKAEPKPEAKTKVKSKSPSKSPSKIRGSPRQQIGAPLRGRPPPSTTTTGRPTTLSALPHSGFSSAPPPRLATPRRAQSHSPSGAVRTRKSQPDDELASPQKPKIDIHAIFGDRGSSKKLRRTPIKDDEAERAEKEQRRKEAEAAYNAWLQRKKREIRRARSSGRSSTGDGLTEELSPEEKQRRRTEADAAFKAWLERKKEEEKGRRTQIAPSKSLQRINNRENADEAFRSWKEQKDTQKREEKRLAQAQLRELETFIPLGNLDSSLSSSSGAHLYSVGAYRRRVLSHGNSTIPNGDVGGKILPRIVDRNHLSTAKNFGNANNIRTVSPWHASTNYNNDIDVENAGKEVKDTLPDITQPNGREIDDP